MNEIFKEFLKNRKERFKLIINVMKGNFVKNIYIMEGFKLVCEWGMKEKGINVKILLRKKNIFFRYWNVVNMIEVYKRERSSIKSFRII